MRRVWRNPALIRCCTMASTMTQSPCVAASVQGASGMRRTALLPASRAILARVCLTCSYGSCSALFLSPGWIPCLHSFSVSSNDA